jgi:hypothetical protein
MRTWLLVDRKPVSGLPSAEVPVIEELSGEPVESRTG